MLRYSFVVLVGLVACAELKTAPPSTEKDVPPATTTDSPSRPQATPARPTSTDAAATPADAGTNDDAGPVSTTPVDTDAEAAHELCDALCGYRNRCAKQPLATAFCTGNCLGLYGPVSDHLRASYVQYAKGCLAAAACSAGSEACLDTWTAIDRSPATVPVVKGCLETVSACPSQLKEAACYGFLQYDDATRAKVDQCFDKTCVAMQDCIDVVTTE